MYNELMAIAQHFGMVTPLLDVTESPWVALFFAAEGAMRRDHVWRNDEASRIAVWRIPANRWKEEFRYELDRETESEELASKQAELKALSAADYDLDRVRVQISNIFPRGFRNERLVAQQGYFVRVTPDLPLDHVISIIHDISDDQVGASWNTKLERYTLPAKLAFECLIHLKKMNITPATIYPDLVGQMQFVKLAFEHQDYAGLGDRRRSLYNSDGSRRHEQEFYP